MMAQSMAAVLRALSQTAKLFVRFVRNVNLDVVCLIVYNRQTLLEIGYVYYTFFISCYLYLRISPSVHLCT